jgi:hypothetical protein
MGEGSGRLGLDGKGTLSQGDRLDDAAGDLDAMGRMLGKGVGPDLGLGSVIVDMFTEATYGEYGGQRAFPPFARAWNEEIDALAGALREIRKKIGDGVTTNRAGDGGTGAGFDRVRPPAADPGERGGERR